MSQTVNSEQVINSIMERGRSDAIVRQNELKITSSTKNTSKESIWIAVLKIKK